MVRCFQNKYLPLMLGSFPYTQSHYPDISEEDISEEDISEEDISEEDISKKRNSEEDISNGLILKKSSFVIFVTCYSGKAFAAGHQQASNDCYSSHVATFLHPAELSSIQTLESQSEES